MTAIHETAYPRIRSNVTDKELSQLYTPNASEVEFASMNTQAPLQKLGLLVLLKTFQRLGYFSMLSDVPQRVIDHIARWVGLEHAIDRLENYDLVGSRWRHTSKIRAWRKIKAFSSEGQQVLFEAYEDACQTKDIIADIINAGIEQLVQQRYELPAFSTLRRAASRVRAQVNRRFYQNVYDQLTASQKASIRNLKCGSNE